MAQTTTTRLVASEADQALFSCRCGMKSRMGLWLVRTESGKTVVEKIRCFRHLSKREQRQAVR